jgi:aminoglycoside 3-N-acetyltransferase
MSGEARTIGASTAPVTQAGLADDLRRLGVRPGSVLLVHTAMSKLGWVCGGAQAVVGGLLDALGPHGTLVVPTHTNSNSEPSEWENPPVPDDWWPVIRATMPPYDPARTPARALGVVVELVRTWPGARRSDHPHYSFAAVGPAAESVTAGHELTSGLGEASPLARVHDLDGDVLLLGAGHDSNTSLHLAEYRIPAPRRGESGAAVIRDGERAWVTWEDVVGDEGDFDRIGAAFDAGGAVTVGRAGHGEARLMHQRDLVAFGVDWMTANRP